MDDLGDEVPTKTCHAAGPGRPLLPIPAGVNSHVMDCARSQSLGAFCALNEGAGFDEDVWAALSATAMNGGLWFDRRLMPCSREPGNP